MKFQLKSSFLGSMLIFLISSIGLAQSPVNEHSVKFLNTNTAFVSGADGLIKVTHDGGLTWQMQSSGTTSILLGNDQYDANLGAAVGENGTILVTADGGATWNFKSSGMNVRLKHVQILNSNVFVACGESGVVLRTEDAGETWTLCLTNTGVDINDLQFISGTIGFAVGQNSTLMRSYDGGTTWETPNIGLYSYNSSAVFMLNETDGSIVGENGLLLSTRNAGNTWSNSGLSITTNINDIVFVSSTVGIAVGDNGLILRTIDAGLSWQAIYGSTPVDLSSVSFANSANGISVGELGTEIYTDDGGRNWYTKGAARVHRLFASFDGYQNQNPLNHGLALEEFSLNQNYPNPFNPSTKINYQLPADSKVTLQVFDMTGRVVRSLINGNQTAGNYSVTLDAKDLASGIYFYRLSATAGANSFVKTMKMMLIK